MNDDRLTRALGRALGTRHLVLGPGSPKERPADGVSLSDEANAMIARILLSALLGTACAGDGTGLDENGIPVGHGPQAPGPQPTLTLSAGVQPIFSVSCALSGCHVGPNAVLGQDLSVGRTFGSVVDVPSVEAPALRRVRPFLPDSSYLVHKIQGTQATVGGSGERMPLIGGAVTAEEIAVVRAWIAAGALDN